MAEGRRTIDAETYSISLGKVIAGLADEIDTYQILLDEAILNTDIDRYIVISGTVLSKMVQKVALQQIADKL